MVDVGCLETSSALPLPERLLSIHRTVVDLIELHAPDILAVERLFFSKNAQTAFAVGQARGVVLLAGAAARVSIREATPNEVKIAVTGYGAADKEQVGRMVAVILQLAEVPTPDDTADALATAICIANAERIPDRRNAGTGAGTAPVMDRSAINPITRGDTPYERAVREALALESRSGNRTGSGSARGTARPTGTRRG